MQEDATADKMYFISRGTVSLTSAKHRLEDTYLRWRVFWRKSTFAGFCYILCLVVT